MYALIDFRHRERVFLSKRKGLMAPIRLEPTISRQQWPHSWGGTFCQTPYVVSSPNPTIAVVFFHLSFSSASQTPCLLPFDGACGSPTRLKADRWYGNSQYSQMPWRHHAVVLSGEALGTPEA